MVEGGPREALQRVGLRARVRPRPTGRLEHVLSHRKLVVDLYRATGGNGTETTTRRSFRLDELADVGVSTLTTKILELTDRESASTRLAPKLRERRSRAREQKSDAE